MTLHESIGRYNVRKTLRFEMKPLGRTVDYLDAHLTNDETRAAALETVKVAIEGEHLAMARRVFKALPDPLPNAFAIREAFRADPEFATLSGRNANPVLDAVIARYRYNGWAVPRPFHDLEGWQPLFIKWQWHCTEQDGLARLWAGRTKADVQTTCPLLRTPARHTPARTLWFDHSPLRMMFDNRSCGLSWLKKDFRHSRNFLMKDGERILIGIVPRSSELNPYALPPPTAAEPAYLLYEETPDAPPRFRAIPRSRIDAPARRGFVYLFELSGRGLRNGTNLNALYLRALLSPDNLADPSFHLDKVCEFYVRKGTDIPRDGKPAHFRQRFTECKYFVSLHVTCNPQRITGNRPKPFGDLAAFVAKNPSSPFIEVVPANGGYRVDGEFLPTVSVRNGGLAGRLAKLVIERDAAVLFDKAVPESVRLATRDKFNYIVMRGRAARDDGGVLRGYQLADRLFVGSPAQIEVLIAEQLAAQARQKAERDARETVRAAKAATKEANRARQAEMDRLATERRLRRERAMTRSDEEIFQEPPFQTGSHRFTFGYKTSDGVRHEQTCRAEDKSEVFQKLRAVGIRPYRVTSDEE